MSKDKTMIGSPPSNISKDFNIPSLHLYGSGGKKYPWSPFVGEGNHNVCVVGQGAEKKNLVKDLLVSTLEQGGKACLFDSDGSWRGLCEKFGGVYIDLDLKNPISLNPFSDVLSSTSGCFGQEFPDAAFENIERLLVSMIGSKESRPADQKEILYSAIQSVWDLKQTAAEVADVAEFLLSKKDSASIILGNRLLAFARSWPYREFFKGPCELPLQSKFIVIGTRNLKSHPILLEALLTLIGRFVERLDGDTTVKFPRLVLIEEASKFFQTKDLSSLLQEFMRMSEYCGVSTVLTEDYLTKFFQETREEAWEVFFQSSWQVIFNQDPDVLRVLRGDLRRNSKMEALLKVRLEKVFEKIKLGGVEGSTGVLIGEVFSTGLKARTRGILLSPNQKSSTSKEHTSSSKSRVLKAVRKTENPQEEKNA